MARQTKGTPQEADKHIGHRLHVRRKLMGVSQDQLAKRVGLTFQQIQKYERGTNRISAGRLFYFSKILGVPITYFYDGFEDDTQQSFEGLPHSVYESDEAIAVLEAFFAIEPKEMREATLRLVKATAGYPL